MVLHAPFAPKQGYFAPIQAMDAKITQLSRKPQWYGKIQAIIASIGLVIVAIINVPTAILQFLRISSFNSFLYQTTIRIIYGKVVLQAYQAQRAAGKLKETIFSQERSKLIQELRKGTKTTLFNPFSDKANPATIALSIATIKGRLAPYCNGLGDNVLNKLVFEFLKGVESEYGVTIQRQLQEVDQILATPDALHQLSGHYLSLVHKNAPKYIDLQMKAQKIINDIRELQQKEGDHRSRIQQLYIQFLSIKEQMYQLVFDEKDIQALNSLEFTKIAHFQERVVEQLENRRAFLLSFQEGSLQTARSHKSTWKKTIASYAAAGFLYYYYQTYGISLTGVSELAAKGWGLYQKTPSISSIPSGVLNSIYNITPQNMTALASSVGEVAGDMLGLYDRSWFFGAKQRKPIFSWVWQNLSWNNAKAAFWLHNGLSVARVALLYTKLAFSSLASLAIQKYQLRKQPSK